MWLSWRQSQQRMADDSGNTLSYQATAFMLNCYQLYNYVIIITMFIKNIANVQLIA